MGFIFFLIVIIILIRAVIVKAGQTDEIKYDKRQMKLDMIQAIAGLAFCIAGYWALYQNFETYLTMFTVLGIIAFLGGGGLFFICLLRLVLGALYFRRLRMYGYEIPTDKKLYQNRPELIPRIADAEEPEGKLCMVNVVLGSMFLLSFLGFAAWNVWLIWFSGFMKADYLFLAVYLACDSIWLIIAWLIYRQADGKKYRDDMETDEDGRTRKIRRPMELWIIVFVILLIITMVAKTGTMQLVKYIFYSRMSYDNEAMQNLSYAISEVYAAHKDKPEGEQLYESLMQGITITEADAPNGSIWEEVVVSLNQKRYESYAVENMNQLAEKMKCADGPAQIWVHLEGERLEVRLLNPLEKTKEKSEMRIHTDFIKK